MLGSLLAAVVCLRLLGTLTRQVDLMVPRAATQREVGAVKAANAAWRSDRQSAAIIAELNVLAQRDPSPEEIGRWRELPEASLADWAALLVRLRQAGIARGSGLDREKATGKMPVPQAETGRIPVPHGTESATQPEGGVPEDFTRLLAGMEFAPPLRVGLSRAHDRWLAAAEAEGLSVRRAESIFHWERYRAPLSAYRSVLRELAGRLRGLAEQYERGGQATEAALAYRVAIRGLTDALADSPQPEVALLAAAELEPMVRALQRLRGAGSSEAAEALAQFRARWMEVPATRIGLMPALFGPSLDISREQAALASLTVAAGLLICAWLTATICLILLMVVGFAAPWRRPVALRSGRKVVEVAAILPAWRTGGAGVIVATAVIVLPTLSLCLYLGSSYVPFIWLSSARSLRAVVLSPLVVILLWLLATRLCMRPAQAAQATTLPRWLVLAGLGLVFAAAVVGGVVPMNGEAWRPPPAVQLFRRAGTLVGLASVVVSAVWAVWAVRARRKAGLPFGTWARGALAVASSALFVLLVAAAVALAVNRQRDGRYEEAFARAVDEPVVARLGSDWWDEHFAPSRALIDG